MPAILRHNPTLNSAANDLLEESGPNNSSYTSNTKFTIPQWPKVSTHHEMKFQFLTNVLKKNQVFRNVTMYRVVNI